MAWLAVTVLLIGGFFTVLHFTGHVHVVDDFAMHCGR